MKILPHPPPGAERGSGLCETYGISVDQTGSGRRVGTGWLMRSWAVQGVRESLGWGGVGGLTRSARSPRRVGTLVSCSFTVSPKPKLSLLKVARFASSPLSLTLGGCQRCERAAARPWSVLQDRVVQSPGPCLRAHSFLLISPESGLTGCRNHRP